MTTFLMGTNELVMDGSFEVTGGGSPDTLFWWNEYRGSDGTGVVEQDNTTSSDGTYCAKLTAATTGTTNINQYIEVVPGDVVSISFDAYGDGTYSARYKLYDVTNAADIISTANPNITASSWTTVTVADTTVPAGCYQMRWYFYAPAAGTGGVVRVDNLSIKINHDQLPMIRRFGDTWATAEELPRGKAPSALGPGIGASRQITLPGGSSHDWGRTDIPPTIPAQSVCVSGYWTASTLLAMQEKAAALGALIGRRSKLWRAEGSSQTFRQWKWARCEGVESDIMPDELQYYAKFTLWFKTDSGPWYGNDWTRTETGSTPEMYCPNPGTAPTTDVVITITAGTSAITGVQLVHYVEDPDGDGTLDYGMVCWTFDETIPVGKSLVVDAKQGTVLLDGADAYSHLTRYFSIHKVPEFMYIAPGVNRYDVTLDGGNSTSEVEIAYYEAWH